MNLNLNQTSPSSSVAYEELELHSMKRYNDHNLLLNKNDPLSLKESRSKQLSSSKKNRDRVTSMIEDKSYHPNKPSILVEIEQLYEDLPVLMPTNMFLIVWDSINLFAILFFIIEIGFLIGFGNRYWHDELQYFSIVAILFFVIFFVDIFISPLKAYYNNGLLVVRRNLIFKRYLRFAVWLDVISLIGLVIPYATQNLESNFFKLIFFTRLYNAFEIDKKFLVLIRSRYRNNHIYGLFRLLIIALIWAHYLGIFFYLIDYTIYRTNYYGPNTPTVCWLYNSPTQYGLVVDSTWAIQYLYSLYFSVGNITTIAYGDIVPLNPAETVYINVCMIFSVILFTSLFKSMLELIIIAQADKFQHSNNTRYVANLLRKNNVSEELSQKIRSFFQLTWNQERFRNKEVQKEMLDQLSRNVKEQLNLCIFSEFMKDFGIIHTNKNLMSVENRSNFLFSLCEKIEFQRISTGSILFREGECFLATHCNVYFCNRDISYGVTIGQGKIPDFSKKIDPDEEITVEKLDFLYENCIKISYITGIFGKTQFFTQEPRTYWAITNKNMELMKLSKANFSEIIQQSHLSEEERQRIFLIKENIRNKLCYLCQQFDHGFKQCKYATYQPLKQYILKIMKQTNNRKIMKNLQKIHKKNMQTFSIYKSHKEIKKQQKYFIESYKEISGQDHSDEENQDNYENQVSFCLNLIMNFNTKSINFKKKIPEKQKYKQLECYEIFNQGLEDLIIEESFQWKYYRNQNNSTFIFEKYNEWIKK